MGSAVPELAALTAPAAAGAEGDGGGGGGGGGAGGDVTMKRAALAACLTCPLCGRFVRDAATITECLHTFCRKCIFEEFINKNSCCCPTCGIDLGCSPLEKIRVDHSLQYVRSKIFPSKRQKVEAAEVTSQVTSPVKRKERSLSSEWEAEDAAFDQIFESIKRGQEEVAAALARFMALVKREQEKLGKLSSELTVSYSQLLEREERLQETKLEAEEKDAELSRHKMDLQKREMELCDRERALKIREEELKESQKLVSMVAAEQQRKEDELAKREANSYHRRALRGGVQQRGRGTNGRA